MALTTVPASLSATALTLTTAAQPNITSVGTLTGLTVGGTISIGDWTNAINIGASNDLQLYHVGGNSHIKSDTGQLIIRTDALRVLNNANSEQILHGDADGAVTLYYDNAVKLATVTGGVNVTGTLTATTLAGTLSTAAQTNITSLGTLSSLTISGDLTVDTSTLKVDSSNNRVGIGTASPAEVLQVAGGIKTTGGFLANTANSVGISYSSGFGHFISWGADGSTKGAYKFTGSASDGSPTADYMVIDSSGNVGIGATPQSFSKLQVKAATDQHVSIFTNSKGLTIGGITDAGGSAALRIAGSPLHFSGSGGGASAGPHLVIDNNGKVGIGISSGLGGLPLQTKVSSGDNKLRMTTANKDAFILELKDASGDVHLGTNTTAGALVIADNGNVNIPGSLTAQNVIDISTTHSTQTTTANQWATIQNTTASGYSEMKWMNNASNYLIIGTIGSTYSATDWSNSSYIYTDRELRLKSNSNLRFYAGGFTHGTYDHMLLTTSGNLLIGKTVTTQSTAGTVLYGNGQIYATASGAQTAVLTRTSSDGPIAIFYKDSSEVGRISSRSNGANMQISTDESGIDFAGDGYLPMRDATITDNSVDIGSASYRYKNIYISGGINFSDATGGVSYSAGNAANLLDDYEEGTWTPTWTGDSSITVNEAKYTRIGRLCYIYFYVSAVNPDTSNAGQTIYGLPFTCAAGSNYPGLTFAYTGVANLHGTFPGITALIAQNSTYIYFHQNNGNTGTVSRAQFRASFNTSSSMALILSGCYHVQ